MTSEQQPWSVAAVAVWLALPHGIACTVLEAMGVDPMHQWIQPHVLRIALDALASDGGRTFGRSVDGTVRVEHCTPIHVLTADSGVRH